MPEWSCKTFTRELKAITQVWKLHFRLPYVLCSTNLGIFETCILYHCSLKSKSCEMKCPCPIPPNFKHLHARDFRFCCCLLDISFHKIGLLKTVIYVVNITFSAILHQYNNIWKLFYQIYYCYYFYSYVLWKKIGDSYHRYQNQL